VTASDPNSPPEQQAPTLRLWQRLDVKVAAVFALLTLVTVGLVGILVHELQER